MRLTDLLTNRKLDKFALRDTGLVMDQTVDEIIKRAVRILTDEKLSSFYLDEEAVEYWARKSGWPPPWLRESINKLLARTPVDTKWAFDIRQELSEVISGLGALSEPIKLKLALGVANALFHDESLHDSYDRGEVGWMAQKPRTLDDVKDAVNIGLKVAANEFFTIIYSFTGYDSSIGETERFFNWLNATGEFGHPFELKDVEQAVKEKVLPKLTNSLGKYTNADIWEMMDNEARNLAKELYNRFKQSQKP